MHCLVHILSTFQIHIHANVLLFYIKLLCLNGLNLRNHFISLHSSLFNSIILCVCVILSFKLSMIFCFISRSLMAMLNIILTTVLYGSHLSSILDMGADTEMSWLSENVFYYLSNTFVPL